MQDTRPRPFARHLLSSLGVVALGPLPLAVASCGAEAKHAALPAPSAKAVDAGPARAAVSPPPSGLPPLAEMPPPGVVGSKKAKKRLDPALYACGGGAKPSGKDPAELVKRLGEACATATKMKPVGDLIRGAQADRERHQDYKLRVEANRCYRVVFATDENVHDAVIMMRDSAGDAVAESAGAALPEDGSVCFTAADEVTLTVGVGAGKGSYAAQVWSE